MKKPIIIQYQSLRACEYSEPEIDEDGKTLILSFLYGQSARMPAEIAALKEGDEIVIEGGAHRPGEVWRVAGIGLEGYLKPQPGETRAERREARLMSNLDIAFKGNVPACLKGSPVADWRREKKAELASKAA